MNVLHFLALPDLAYRTRALIALTVLRCLFPKAVPCRVDAVVLLLPRQSTPARGDDPAHPERPLAAPGPALELHPLLPSPAPGHPTRLLGAHVVQFPKSSPSKTDLLLMQEFNGANADEVARKFGITKRALRRLIARQSHPDAAPN